MPKINLEISQDLHTKAKALHGMFSISQLARLGMEWAVAHYSQVLAPADIGASSSPLRSPNSRPTPSPAPSPSPTTPATTTEPPKRISINPVGDALKPWTDHRKHEWFDLEGFTSYLGISRADVASVIDINEDVDRDNNEREILDRAAIERVFINLPAERYKSMDRYHAMNAWFDGR